MISPELLEILRCPMDPSHTRLALQQDHLVCERCRTRFRIQDGFPVLVIEEAELPPGCATSADLPCQREPGYASETRQPMRAVEIRPQRQEERRHGQEEERQQGDSSK